MINNIAEGDTELYAGKVEARGYICTCTGFGLLVKTVASAKDCGVAKDTTPPRSSHILGVMTGRNDPIRTLGVRCAQSSHTRVEVLVSRLPGVLFTFLSLERIAAEKRAEGIVGSTDGAAESATEATSGEVEEEKKADSSVNQQELIQESNEYVQFLPVMSCTA